MSDLGQHVALFVRCRSLVSSGIDARCEEALVFATGLGRVLGMDCLVGKLATPPLDPAVMIVRRPPAAVLGAIAFGASNQLLRMSHVRCVDELLQLGASRPQPVLFCRLERRSSLTSCDAECSSLLGRSKRPFHGSKLVLVRAPLREPLLCPVVLNVERALRVIRKALASHASGGLRLGHALSRGLATNSVAPRDGQQFASLPARASS